MAKKVSFRIPILQELSRLLTADGEGIQHLLSQSKERIFYVKVNGDVGTKRQKNIRCEREIHPTAQRTKPTA